MNEFIWPIRVYYEDTDAGEVVYYANYLKFMERARTEWLRQLGIEQPQLKQNAQIIFVVRQITIDYLKPAVFNDLLQVNTQVVHLGKASMTMNQTILRESQTLCTATVKIASVNSINWRPQPFPTEIREKFLKITN